MSRNWFILTIGAFTLAATLGSNGRAEDGATLRSKYVRVEGVLNPLAVERECDAIVARLVERYGVPRRWKTFPVRFRRPNGGPVAGYTAYARPDVAEIVLYMTFEESRGGALDHELTHAFFFYYLDDYFDLFFNEGSRRIPKRRIARDCAARSIVDLRAAKRRPSRDSTDETSTIPSSCSTFRASASSTTCSVEAVRDGSPRFSTNSRTETSGSTTRCGDFTTASPSTRSSESGASTFATDRIGSGRAR